MRTGKSKWGLEKGPGEKGQNNFTDLKYTYIFYSNILHKS